MKDKQNIWVMAGVLISFLSLAGLGISMYTNRQKSTILEIKTISNMELTRPLNVEHLSFVFFFDDTIPVEHLWQSSYVITNIGETTLYGDGFDSKNIKGETLSLQLLNCENLLSIEKVGGNADINLQRESLCFNQWRPEEFIELRILSDGQSAPELKISERDIKDGHVKYTQYSPEEKLVNRRFVDEFPKSLYYVLWWVALLFDIFLFVVAVIEAVDKYHLVDTGFKKVVYILAWALVLFISFAPIMWMF